VLEAHYRYRQNRYNSWIQSICKDSNRITRRCHRGTLWSGDCLSWIPCRDNILLTKWNFVSLSRWEGGISSPPFWLSSAEMPRPVISTRVPNFSRFTQSEYLAIFESFRVHIVSFWLLNGVHWFYDLIHYYGSLTIAYHKGSGEYLIKALFNLGSPSNER
jgi:hypothetical protein